MDHAVAWLEVAAGPFHHTSGNIYYLLPCECILLLFDLNPPHFYNEVQKLHVFLKCIHKYIALFFLCVTHTKWLPESPRFNILMGQREKAMTTIANIAKENNKPMPQGRISIFKQVSSSRSGDQAPGEVFDC